MPKQTYRADEKFREFINTQLLQAVLRDPQWAGKLTEEDRRELSPLFWSHVNPYGRFRLDMDTRLDLTAA